MLWLKVANMVVLQLPELILGLGTGVIKLLFVGEGLILLFSLSTDESSSPEVYGGMLVLRIMSVTYYYERCYEPILMTIIGLHWMQRSY